MNKLSHPLKPYYTATIACKYVTTKRKFETSMDVPKNIPN